MPNDDMQMKTKTTIKWYEKPSVILLAVIAVGPLAIPLIWRSPELRLWIKWSATVALIALTIWFFKASASIYQTFMADVSSLQEALRQAR